MSIQAKPASAARLVLVLLAAALVWGLDAWRKSHPTPVRQAPGAASGSSTRVGGYEVFRNCTLAPDRHNDGDSFQVRLPDGRVETFRLYFVDTPESEFKSYAGGETNHDRIRRQAEYFGISPEQAVGIGRKGRKYTLDLLAAGPFTLYTVWDSPFNDRRYHAFIEPSGPGASRPLDEQLVEQGLCRIFTKGADTPGGIPMQRRKERLLDLERQARERGAGAWGLR